MESPVTSTQLSRTGTASGVRARLRERRSPTQLSLAPAEAMPVARDRGGSWTRSGQWRWSYVEHRPGAYRALAAGTEPADGWTHRALSGPELGDVLPGFEIGAPLGCGTSGVVYAARHVASGQAVAIKQLWPNLSADVVARRRFAEEARVLASLEHRHIVRVFDYVEGDICALVLELVSGGSLGDRLRHGRVSVSAACTLVLGLLAGLEHAHQRGVVHRDIKPANLLFTAAGRLKVADFGVAKIIDGRREAGAALTLDGRPVGTPAYMAPEQLNPALGSVSAATDVWASGTILLELLTGRRPLEGVLNLAVARGTRTAAILECPADVVLPRALTDVVAVATARLPTERYQSAAEFARRLRRASRSCSAS